jgi:pimeloyl-ACP methyl ester carboxylesterase
MPYFTTEDGTRLNYAVAGSGDPPLLYIHGWCSNLRHWNHQVRAFVRTHQILRVDRRGHGRSAAPTSDYSGHTHAEDVAALATSLGVGDAVVVGHAGGGPTALELAGHYPSLVKALVLVDAGLYQGVSKEEAARSPSLMALSGLDYRAEFIRRYRGFIHPLSGEELAARVADDAVRTPQQVILAELEAILTANTRAMAKLVTQPVLWAVGSGSQQTAAGVREYLPQAQFAQVVGGGHFFHLEVPDQFNAMLRRFIQSL